MRSSKPPPINSLIYSCAFKSCGKQFKPHKRKQACCSPSCAAQHAGVRRYGLDYKPSARSLQRAANKAARDAAKALIKPSDPKMSSQRPVDPCANVKDFKITESDAREFCRKLFPNCY